MTYRILKATKRIALVAHDFRKNDLLNWVQYNREILSQHELIATGTTGKIIEEQLSLKVRKMLSGPLGGDQQIGAMIAQGEVDILFFFWDPMAAQPHDPDVKALLRIGAVWNIPMASDRATADFLITSPLMRSEYKTKLEDYDAYTNRQIL